MSPLVEVIGVYAAANAVALVLFGLDKLAARSDQRRVPERSLLFWAVFGWLGAKAAQRMFRHKTRKQPFATQLNGALVLHLLLIGAALAWRAGWITL